MKRQDAQVIQHATYALWPRLLATLALEVVAVGVTALVDAALLAANAHWFILAGLAGLAIAALWEQILQFVAWKRGSHPLQASTGASELWAGEPALPALEEVVPEPSEKPSLDARLKRFEDEFRAAKRKKQAITAAREKLQKVWPGVYRICDRVPEDHELSWRHDLRYIQQDIDALIESSGGTVDDRPLVEPENRVDEHDSPEQMPDERLRLLYRKLVRNRDAALAAAEAEIRRLDERMASIRERIKIWVT